MSIINTFIQNAKPYWQEYTEHQFVQQLAQGTLPKACFQHYLKQDYCYLLHYVRALGLGIYKSDNFAHARAISNSIQVVLEESLLHLAYCESWGIRADELNNVPESVACVAYTRYMLDCGSQGALVDLFVALAPCAVGYARIGEWIAKSNVSPINNPYQTWIDTYAGEAFQLGVQGMCELLDQLCADLTPTQIKRLQHIFNTATKMETAFWLMGLDRS